MHRRVLTTGTLLFAALAVAPTQTQKLDLSEKALVARASKYVAEYEKQFAFLIADEDYRQKLFDADGRLAQTRILKSELFMTYLIADGEWLAVRDVMEVDGARISNRDDLRALLSRGQEIRGSIGKVIARNAQYNIGRIERNFNEPTLPLLLLDAKRTSRINFDRRNVTQDGNTTLVTLAFEERGSPTLVSARNEGPIRSKGEFVMDAATGTIRRTVFLLARPGVDIRLETTYSLDPKLEMWLPAIFLERYESGGQGGRRRNNDAIPHEVIEGEANYSNYRRFGVTATIKKH